MADPRRMTPEEHGEAYALLVRAVTDPDWLAASQAPDDLVGKLVVVRRLLEAEECLPTRAAGRPDPTAAGPQAPDLLNRSMNAGGPAWPPRREPPALRLQAATRQIW